MTLWHASIELPLSAAGLAAATATESLYTAAGPVEVAEAVEGKRMIGLDSSG